MVGFALETESAVKSSMGGPYQPSLKASDITKKIENFLFLKLQYLQSQIYWRERQMRNTFLPALI